MKFSNDFVNFNQVKKSREILFEKSFENFQKQNQNYQEILNEFYEKEKYWIDDLTLFLTIKEKVKQTFLY